jgi:hypothetical protein
VLSGSEGGCSAVSFQNVLVVLSLLGMWLYSCPCSEVGCNAVSARKVIVVLSVL